MKKELKLDEKGIVATVLMDLFKVFHTIFHWLN